MAAITVLGVSETPGPHNIFCPFTKKKKKKFRESLTGLVKSINGPTTAQGTNQEGHSAGPKSGERRSSSPGVAWGGGAISKRRELNRLNVKTK